MRRRLSIYTENLMLKQVIVMRKDLNMRKGKIAAQAAAPTKNGSPLAERLVNRVSRRL